VSRSTVQLAPPGRLKPCRKDPVPNREVLCRREPTRGKLRDDCAALRHFLENILILLGINPIDPAAENSDAGTAFRN
jgi:hypothetical protein